MAKLFEKVKANENGDNKDTFTNIRRELEIHTHIEEQIFYPHLLDVGNEELKSMTREGLEEHKQVKMVLADLSNASEGFEPKLKVLIEDVEHHVNEEETEMFPLVQDQVDDETLHTLGAKMQAEKERFASGSTRSASAG